MPVRFQVDPDFYDHPKVIGLSDAAVALWTRAGSYSVAKLLDGFVPENALNLLSRDTESASAELVKSGLWRRTRGGYTFHQWDERNLTRARVEADRDYERQRKRDQRANARAAANGLLNGHSVPELSHRDTAGIPGGVPAVSVSTSVSSVPPSPQRGRKATPDDDPDWSAFWSAYPRKVGKGGARKSWSAALRKADAATIIAGAKRYAEERRGESEQYTAHPSTWLNQERWADQGNGDPRGGLDPWWEA